MAGKSRKSELKSEVIQAAQVIRDAGEMAEGIAETVLEVVPKASAKGAKGKQTALKAVRGTVSAAAGTVAAAGKVATRVMDVLEGTDLEKELTSGKLEIGRAGGALEAVVNRVMESGKALKLMSNGRVVATLSPERKAGGTSKRQSRSANSKSAVTGKSTTRSQGSQGTSAKRSGAKSSGGGSKASSGGSKAGGKGSSSASSSSAVSSGSTRGAKAKNSSRGKSSGTRGKSGAGGRGRSGK